MLCARSAGTGAYWAYVRIPSTVQRRRWPPQQPFNTLLAPHRLMRYARLDELVAIGHEAVPRVETQRMGLGVET